MREAVDVARESQGDNVQPAAPPRSPCGRAELEPVRPELVPGLIVELGGVRPGADAGGVSFCLGPEECFRKGPEECFRRSCSNSGMLATGPVFENPSRRYKQFSDPGSASFCMGPEERMFRTVALKVQTTGQLGRSQCFC